MKVLLKKLKKVDGLQKFFFFLSLILYILSLSFFVYSIFKYKVVLDLLSKKELTLVISVFVLLGIWFLIYLLCGLITMIAKKNKTFIFITILTFIFSLLLCGLSIVLDEIKDRMDLTQERLTYTTNLIALKETSFNSSYKIGMIDSDQDIEGNILAKKLIEKENLSNKIELYEDYSSMINDLYNGKIGACFVSANYAVLFESNDFKKELIDNGETPISKRVKVLYEYSEDMDNQDSVTLAQSKEKTLTEPFTVLVMGVDSTINGLKANQAFNGDTLILATFNPNTLTATMFSIPRDMYVPIACNHNRYAKINSSAAYGSSCVINTVQQLTGINIDYYVKINFTGVVDLVDALGGGDVNVEEPDFSKYNGRVCEQDSQRRFGNNLICMDPGYQTLTGEQALAYARCRHLYATSDIARNQHQQEIIEALAKKLKTLNSIDDFNKILNSVSNNIETNITNDQILSFFNVGKDMLTNSEGNTLAIKKTFLTYYNLNVYLPRSGMYTSALGYYPESLEAIKKLMRVNLELEQEEPIKTFSISYNEKYEIPVTGKNLTGGTKLGLAKSFIGSTQSNAESWCTANGISCSFQIKTDYNPEGLICDQSVHEGELLKGISSITFYISDGLGTPPPVEEPTENPNEDVEDPENPDDNEDTEEPTIPGGPTENDNGLTIE